MRNTIIISCLLLAFLTSCTTHQPQYQNGGYAERGPWRVANKWNLGGTEIDHSTHVVYANMGTDTWLMAKGQHTDNNCVWFNFADYGKTNAQRLLQYEADHNCRVLGAWGHYDGNNVISPELECVGMAEFYPAAAGRGTIIVMGLAAYHWANPADKLKILTRDILYYLNIDEVPAFAWITEPADGKVGETQIVQIEDKASAHRWTSSDPDIVEIVADPDHEDDTNYRKLVLKAEGEATITATHSADGYKIPKNVTATTQVTKTITVSKSTPTGVDSTNANIKAVKEIRNGQVVIIRDNKTYNVLGIQL